MEDERIVSLYFARNEDAIAETDKKYGGYCAAIAYAILYSAEEAEECKNDTYLKAWNAMPPQRPSRLKAFLGRIARHTALDRYDYENAKKRQTPALLIWDEAIDAMPDCPSDPADSLAIKDAVNGFLSSLKKNERVLFMQRYYYFASISEIARLNGMSAGAVKVALHRMRLRCKQYFEERGIML